ncbi:MAG: hypothetical protein Q4B45_03725 [Coriobacteriia bacterium]|nr:hypothetical protein [Coriobacteriia bacterium]
MPVIFSHDTALEILRSVPPQTGLLQPLEGEVPFGDDGLTTDYRELARIDALDFGIRRRPLHVLIGKGQRRCQSRGVVSHEFTKAGVPYSRLWGFRERAGIPSSVYLCSPATLFAQMAKGLPLAELICLGYELCGRYSHFAPEASGFYDRPALLTKERARRALGELGGMRGIGQARRALSFVSDGARSPMETIAACELTLPAELGGHGFAQPCLNFEIELDSVAAGLAGKKLCRVDIAWPGAKVGIEYNGREFHPDPTRDRKRVEALEHMGWTIRTVEMSDLTDLRRLDAIARTLEGKAPRRKGCDASAGRRQRQALHQELLAATRCGLGLEGALFGVDVAAGSVPYHV